MLLDTDVLVDILRNHPPATAWLTSLGNTPIAVPGLYSKRWNLTHKPEAQAKGSPSLALQACVSIQTVCSIVAMEVVQGCRNLAEQQRAEALLRRCSLHWPSLSDCMRAFAHFSAYHLSHNLGLLDSLIAETAVGLGLPLATFNVKHYAVIPNLTTIQPY